MSAATLRKAAEKLREQATKATAGPWHAEGRMGQTRNIHAAPGVLRGQGRDLAVAERVFGRDATYIATMHPGVGLALADWLDSEVAAAEWREGQQEHMNADRVRPEPFPVYYDRTTEKAIALAALILGGAS